MRRQGLFIAVAIGAVMLSACSSGSSSQETAAGATSQAPDPAASASSASPMSSSAEAAPGDDEIVIGFASAKTSFMSFYDDPILKAAELAVRDINAQGGINGTMMRIISNDSASDIARAAPAAQELLDQGADVIVTSCDYDFGGPSARTATEAGKLALGCASGANYGFEGLGPLTFNTYSASPAEAAAMAQTALDLGKTKAFMLKNADTQSTIDVCANVDTVFTKLGGQIVADAEIRAGDVAIGPQIQELRDSDADVIFLCAGPDDTGIAAIKQLRDASDLPIIGQLGLEGTFWLDCCKGISDVYVPALASTQGDDPNPDRAAFMDKYQAEYGEAPPVSLAMTGYSAIETIAKAYEQANSTDGQALANVIQTFTDEQLVAGLTTYTATCHVPLDRGMVVMQFQDGKLQYFGEVKPEFLPPTPC